MINLYDIIFVIFACVYIGHVAHLVYKIDELKRKNNELRYKIQTKELR